jgi:hypothetical protein
MKETYIIHKTFHRKGVLFYNTSVLNYLELDGTFKDDDKYYFESFSEAKKMIEERGHEDDFPYRIVKTSGDTTDIVAYYENKDDLNG